jgi:hypothetical protein
MWSSREMRESVRSSESSLEEDKWRFENRTHKNPKFERDLVPTGNSGATLKPFEDISLREESDDEYDDRIDMERFYKNYPDHLIPIDAKMVLNVPGVRKRAYI